MREIARGVLLAGLGLVLAGCVALNAPHAVSLPAYAPQVAAPTTNAKTPISITLADLRKNQSAPITILDSKGVPEQAYPLSADLLEWFKNALYSELRARGINAKITTQNAASGSAKSLVEVFISRFDAAITGYTGQNMTGQIDLVVRSQNGGITTTSRISAPQGQFAISRTATAFEPFIAQILNDGVRRVADTIAPVAPVAPVAPIAPK